MIVRDAAVAGGERTKILDFGIAKLRESVPTKGTNTHKDLLMGTPSYMSPEQCRGAGGVDEKTDVYSLGVVLYRALAGRPPFVCVGAGDTMAQHIYQDPPALSEQASWLPASLTGLVHRMLGKDKDQRPSMSEVATDLGKLGAELADFVLPEFPEDLSGSGAHKFEDSTDELSGPSEEHADDEDSALETIAVSENAVSLYPGASAAALSAQSQSAPSLLGWSVSNTGQARGGSRSGSEWLAIVAVLGFVLLVVGVLVARFTSGPRSVASGPGPAPTTPTVEPAAAKPQPSPPVAPSRVVWTLETSPAGAEIVRVSDGQVLGRTPWHTEVVVATGVEEVRLRLAGHVERVVGLQRNANSHSSVELMPIAVPPATPKAADQRSQLPSKNSGKNPKKGHVKIVLED
jgi:serine/threonine protein kinase